MVFLIWKEMEPNLLEHENKVISKVAFDEKWFTVDNWQ